MCPFQIFNSQDTSFEIDITCIRLYTRPQGIPRWCIEIWRERQDIYLIYPDWNFCCFRFYLYRMASCMQLVQEVSYLLIEARLSTSDSDQIGIVATPSLYILGQVFHRH